MTPTRARQRGLVSAGKSGATSTAIRIGESAMPIDATNHAIFRRFSTVSTVDFQIKYGMAGAATVNTTGQKRSVAVLLSKSSNGPAHADLLDSDINPISAFEVNRITPTTLAATRKVFAIVRAQRGLGSRGNSHTKCHNARARNASQ